jgi:hypothetical protein
VLPLVLAGCDAAHNVHGVDYTAPVIQAQGATPIFSDRNVCIQRLEITIEYRCTSATVWISGHKRHISTDRKPESASWFSRIRQRS